jgi:hypothetical protein
MGIAGGAPLVAGELVVGGMEFAPRADRVVSLMACSRWIVACAKYITVARCESEERAIEARRR